MVVVPVQVVAMADGGECDPPPPNVDLSPWLEDFASNWVGDVLVDKDERAAEKTSTGGPACVAPPLGLKLRKSSSFLDLINCARSRGSSMFAML